MHAYLNELLAGKVAVARGVDRLVESLGWNPHPVFSGVHMKNLVTGADTDGTVSLHLVRVAPGSVIGSHIHEAQWELHQVVAGSGECALEDCEVAYSPGVTQALPPGVPHEVRASGDGLHLLATFSPAVE